jgi:hypothetical protein
VRDSLRRAGHACNVAGDVAAAFGRFIGRGVVSRPATTTTNWVVFDCVFLLRMELAAIPTQKRLR